MATFNIPPLKNWQDFQNLCCDLWKTLWKDPDTQQNGRIGQPQHGVDIYGRPDRKDLWAGVQCKDGIVTEKEIKEEVEKAKQFKPTLSSFIIATTASRDQKIQEVARTITDNHQKTGSFSVSIWFWDDIETEIRNLPDILEKYYPELYRPGTKTIKKDIDEIKSLNQTILEKITESEPVKPILPQTITPSLYATSSFTAIDVLTPEYQSELDYSRDLIRKYKPREALAYLQNLKDRIWSHAVPIVKFRLLTNIASSKLSLNSDRDAARLFIEALQYNPDDEKALLNAALGHMILGQSNKAIEYANKVLQKNMANSRAYSTIIQSSSFNESVRLEEIIERVPKELRSTPEVAYAIGHLCRKKADFIEAEKWFRIANENIEDDNPDQPEFKAALAETMLEQIVKEDPSIYVNQIKEENKIKILEIIQLLTSAWNVVVNTELRNFRLQWIVNRGIAKRLLGDFDGAGKDMDIALEYNPSDPQYMKHRALIYCEVEDRQNAILLLRKIQSKKEIPEAPLLLADMLRLDGNVSEALAIINDLVVSSPTEQLMIEAKRLLVQIYISLQDIDSAKNISRELLCSDSNNILFLVDAAHIARISGDANEAKKYLRNARQCVSDSTTFRELLELGNEFYFLEEFEDAISIFEKIADVTTDNFLTRRLLNSYYRFGKYEKVLEVCQKLRKKYGPLKRITEMESFIYEEIGDLKSAKNVCQDYLKQYPDDFDMRLRFAIVNLRDDNTEEVDKFLSTPIEINNIALESGIQIVYLFATRNQMQRAVDLMYELRRKFFNESTAHLKYIGLFLMKIKDKEDWLETDVVSVNTAVCVEDSSKNKEWYIIEDRRDSDIHRKEINLTHPLTKQLLNKKCGEEILLKDSPIDKEYGTVIEIKSKFVYALHESLSSFEKLFPGMPGLFSIKVEPPLKEDQPPKGFEKILEQVTKLDKTRRQLEKFYREGKLTIGAFAALLGRSPLEVWGGLISNENLGIKCCNGTFGERSEALSLLNKKPRLIVDIISLMTLSSLNLQNAIISAFGKPGIAQSTIDYLKHTIDGRSGIQSKGFMTLGKEGEKFVRQEISEEDVKRNIEYLRQILSWIQKSCDVIPCRAALTINAARKQQLDDMLGEQFVDTMLISSQNNSLLFSDDERLRSFAKNEFKVEGVWTQAILMYLLNKNIIDRDSYNKIVLKLVLLHYHFTSIDSGVIMEATSQSSWTASYPFTVLIRNLSGKISDDSSLVIAIDFIYKLWTQALITKNRADFLFNLLDAIVDGRDISKTLKKIVSFVRAKFRLLPIAEREILSLIKRWKKSRIY